MSDNTLKFDKGKNAVLVENNAQTIFDHLNELEKDSKTYSKRWFWELLQNAKDSVDSNSKVSVKVILYENSLSFLHTGDAFEESDILHLIFHGSSKKSLEGKTGRFGTGFMSTHLLSRKVNITGKLSDNTYFKFDLNREANRILEQQENLESSYTRFCSSNTEKNYSDSKYNTIFTYDLAEPSFKIAVSGIEQLQQIMPFVMAFNEKIENIEVVNNKTITIIRGLKKELIFKEKKIINQEILYNDIFYNVVFIKSDDSDVAVLLEKKEGVISLVNLDEGYPKLFFDFPLFGTERFGCPVIINSKKFDLKGERDGIYLGVDNKDKPTIVENKRIISNSLSSINILIEFLFENFPIKLYNLYKLKSPFEYNWLDNEWLESIYTITIQSLLNTPCVKLNGKALPLNSIALPFSKSIEAKLFYNLVTDFKKESTPDFEDVTEWISVAVGFSNIEKKDITDYKSIIDERELCILIENNKSLDEINNIFISESSCEKSDMSLAINWLNDLFNLFSKEQTELLSSLYCIIPNQKKQLTKREVNALFFDQIGNEEIKSVAESFDWDIKSELKQYRKKDRWKVIVFKKILLPLLIQHMAFEATFNNLHP